MNVVLLERVEHLGAVGDVVTVKPGYARNFLLPLGKALRATDDNLLVFKERKVELEKASDARKVEAEKAGKALKGKKFVMVRQASEQGQLYGSVTNRDVSELLNMKDHDVARNQVRLQKPIKTIGLFDVPLVLNPDVTLTVSINVARSEEEAVVQEKTGKAVIAAEEKKTSPAPVAQDDASDDETQTPAVEASDADTAATEGDNEAA